MQPQDRRRLFFLLGLTALLYLPSLFGDFVFDDHYLILENGALHSVRGLREAFTEDYYGQANPRYALGYYRPLSLTTHWLDWQIWGARPFGHHLTSLLLHLAAVTALYFLIIALFENPHLALLSSTVFAVHPSHASTVTFVSGRVDALAALFTFLCLLAFIRKRAWAGPFYFAALLAKEISVTTPLLALWKERSKGTRSALVAMIPFAAALAAVIALRTLLIGMPGRKLFSLTAQGITDSALSLLAYLRFLVLPPLSLYLEPAPGQMAILPGLLAAAVFVAGACLLRNRLVGGWSLVWLVTLLPVLGLVRIETLLDERFLYLPSVGFCLLAGGWLLQYLLSRIGDAELPERHVLVAAVVIALLYAPILVVRQAYWLNDLSLWTSAVKTDPSSSRIRLRLGIALLQSGDPAGAEEEFRAGLSLAQESPIFTASLYTHLATAQHLQGKHDEVEKLYKEALKLSPSYYTAHFNLGLFYKQNGRIDEAIAEFRKAVESNPKSGAAHRSLGELLLQTGHAPEGNAHLHKAEELDVQQ